MHLTRRLATSVAAAMLVAVSVSPGIALAADPNPLEVGASSLSLIQQIDSSTTTSIHNAGHRVVTTVSVGTNVHDLVTVTGQPGQPVATGNVNIDWFLNGDCTGAPAQNSGSIGPLDATGKFHATGFNFSVATAGFRAFQAHYLGDATYLGSDGACEPLRVVDANIVVVPDGVNRVGAAHTLSGRVNVNDGNGFVSAPDGTVIDFTIDSGPGTLDPASCTTSGGTGSCSVDLTSAVTGVTTVSAHTMVSVNGMWLTRHTNGVPASSGPAQKTWVNGRILIAPNATNEVGQPHTFIVTLEKDTGSGTFVPAAGETVTVTLTPTNGATPTPAGPFTGTTDAAGQFLVTFTSPAAGQVTGHASSTLSVNGSDPFTVSTDGVAPNSGPAVKTFVDANIQITPQTANNPVTTNHTLTGHVNVNAGGGAGYVNAPDGTLITFSLTNSGGASAAFVGPNTCTTAGGTGSCTVVISSSTTGATSIHATTTVSVGGVSLTRSTGDGKLGDSADATKTWSDDVVSTRVLDASDADITNTTVPGGTVVHDEATVAKAGGTPASAPAPTGTVTFTLYDNGTCDGAVLATDANKPLSGGVATSATFTTPAAGGTFSYLAQYDGDTNYPAHTGICEPLEVQPTTSTGQVTPANVDCADFVAGAPTLLQINYRVSGDTIFQSINPGVFFYWTTITTTVPNQVVTVSQSNSSTNSAALFAVHQGWDRLYAADCSSYTSGTVISGDSGASFTVVTPGTYHIGVQYSTKSIVGTAAPDLADIRYDFTTSLGGNTGASVLLKKQ